MSTSTKKKTRIKQLMAQQGRQIKWYASRLGYSQQSTEFYKVVDGRKAPRADRRVFLARILNVKANQLWGICPKTGHVVAYTVKQKTDAEGEEYMPRVDDGYRDVTMDMVDMVDRWQSVYPLSKLSKITGLRKDILHLPFVRFNTSGKAKIQEVAWEAAEVEIARAIKKGTI